MHQARSKNLLSHLRCTLRSFAADERGFAAAESVLLALLLISISVTVGAILQQAALGAATNINKELAGSSTP